VPPQYCGPSYLSTRDGILTHDRFNARSELQTASSITEELIERVQEERDRLIQEASDWRDQTQAFELFWKQQLAERDFAEPTAEKCPGHSTFGQ
jgi:hypothetical protein